MEIEELKAILASEQKVLDIIKKELTDIKNRFADERRTHIDMTAVDYIEDESLIPQENIVITLTKKGYIKRLPVDTYKTQNRGGVGVKGMSINEEDFVEQLLYCSTHIMFYSLLIMVRYIVLRVMKFLNTVDNLRDYQLLTY